MKSLAWGFESSLLTDLCIFFHTVLSVSYTTHIDNCRLDAWPPKGDRICRAVQHSLKCMSCFVLKRNFSKLKK